MVTSISCNRDKMGRSFENNSVYIKSINGKFEIFKNGKPFLIKGASGYTHLRELKQAGGNTIRVWDTIGLRKILDTADHYQLSVIIGLPMPPSEFMDEFYNDDIKTKNHIKKITTLVNEFKNRPSVLFWCLGNELAFPYRPKYRKFYKTFNDLVTSIHTDDPAHPVTTTLQAVSPKNIFNITYRTGIDFLSFNLFGGLLTFREDIEKLKWFWKGPYLFTEWGIEGPWSTGIQNTWGSYIESTSTKKAEEYLEIYRKYVPVHDSRFLGALVFYWGQKQEYTPTWFSFFDDLGNKTEAVNVMQYIWTNKKIALHAPLMDYILLNDKGAKNNIFLTPNTTSTGKVILAQRDSANLRYKWKLFKEDWHKPNGIFLERKPKKLPNLIVDDLAKEVRFRVPANEGPYRLFVYVYDNRGFLASANIPFYVIDKP